MVFVCLFVCLVLVCVQLVFLESVRLTFYSLLNSAENGFFVIKINMRKAGRTICS